MVAVIAEFFSIIGLSQEVPSNFAELIPYLLEIFVGLALVCAVFSVFGKLFELFMNWSRWK